MRVPVLLIAILALLVAGCGDADPDPTPTPQAKNQTPPVEPPPAPVAEDPPAPRPEMPPQPAPRTGSLKPRAGDAPLAAGAVAPGFEAHPETKGIVVFYRGHW